MVAEKYKSLRGPLQKVGKQVERRAVLLISIILTMLLSSAIIVCASGADQLTEDTVTVVDSIGREVEIPSQVDRIVLLTADNCELAVVLDATDKIVGAQDGAANYAEIGEYFDDVVNVGHWSEPDLEMIASLDPDVVFGYESSIENGVVDRLNELGIPFIVCECNKIQTFEKDIELMGVILGKEEKAEEFLEFHNSIIDLIESNVGSDQAISLYFTGGSKRPYSTYGADIDPYCNIVGATNIASGLSEVQLTVDSEWILTQNPEVIIEWIGSTKINPTPDPLIEVRDTYMNDPALNKTAAVMNGNVHIMGWRIFKGLRYPIGLLYWAKWCHPDQFQDIDPEEYHREYLKNFLNIDLENMWAL